MYEVTGYSRADQTVDPGQPLPLASFEDLLSIHACLAQALSFAMEEICVVGLGGQSTRNI